MTAEKLTTIAENTPKVYGKGYEDGKNSVVQVERFAKELKFHSLNDFGKSTVELNLDKVTTLADFVYIKAEEQRNTIVEHIIINCANEITSIVNAFYSSSIGDFTLKRITLNMENHILETTNNAFRNARALETIDGTPLNLSKSTTNRLIFHTCSALVEVRFAPNTIKADISCIYCSNLSTETIQSIIDGLADLTGGTAQTLTLHATVGAKLTDEQKATITAKNWELVY